MAKLTEFKNPIRAEKVNALSPAEWVQSIGYVAWVGAVMVLGAKVLVAADKILPGNNTPASYKAAAATPTPTSGVVVY